MTAPVNLVYFSPTGTTRMIVNRIAAELTTAAVESHDLTLSSEAPDLLITDRVTIIAVPVYAGRVPEVCIDRLKQVRAVGAPAVLVVLYGNREFEDALLELHDIAKAKGFSVIAAAAFIGEHSYSTQSHPVAAGRPDANDLQKASELGKIVAAMLSKGISSKEIEIPGNRPYRDRPSRVSIAPGTIQELCISCAACEKVCPTTAIRMNGTTVETDASTCILCCACVKRCPEQVRKLDHPILVARREMLTTQYSARKEPLIFVGATDESSNRYVS